MEEHVRLLSATAPPRCASTAASSNSTISPNPDGLADYERTNFGPFVAAYASVAGDADRTAELDRATAQLAREINRATPGERPQYELEYLLATAVAA